jgi:hypothetical protein
MHKTATTILLICSIALQAQISSEALQGDWIQVGSKFEPSVGKEYQGFFNLIYLRMSFRGNAVTISYNSIEQGHITVPYFIRGDTLVTGKNRSKLDFHGPNEMSLTHANENMPVLFTKLLPGSLSDLSPDSTYNASMHVCPKFNGNLTRLFFDAGLIDFPAVKHDRIIAVEFDLKKDGNIQNVKIESDHSAWRNNLFRKALIKSRPNWQVPIVNDQPVSTHLQFNVIRIGGKTIRDRQVAERHFRYALDIIKSNPDEALKRLTMAISLVPDNAKYYFYRALVYYYMLNTDMMCQNMVLAKSLCPFLPTGFVDQKEQIQVNCFTD